MQQKRKVLAAAALAGCVFTPAIARSQVVVDNNSGLVTGTGSTPITSYSINSGDNVVVLEVLTRTNTPGVSSTPTYGGTAMTLAASQVSAQGTNRAAYIYYLASPNVGSANFNIAYNDSTGNDFAYAFNLKNVNLSNLPTTTNFTATTDAQGNPSASVTINSIPAGALAVGVQVVGLNGGTNPGTFSNLSSDSTTGIQQFSSPNNNSTDGQSVYFSPLVGGSTTFTFDDAGAQETKDVLDVAVFSAEAEVPEPTCLGIIGVAAMSLLARRRAAR